MCEYRFRLPAGASLILASASPRRRELLSGMGFSFSLCPCEVDERVPQGMHPAEAVVLLARRKAEAVAPLHPNAIILASDTLVEIDSLPLGKPRDEADALRTLMRLCGNEHRVHTGVALIYRGRVLAEKDTTRVFMRAFEEAEARAYVATGEPMDKAGAYGIQGLGGRLVERIEGSYDTVVGLPTRLLDDMLCRLMEAVP